MNHLKFCIACSLFSWLVLSVAAQSAEDAAATEVIGYDRVREVLRKRCVTCHNLDELRGDLNLSDMGGILAGSGSGPVVVAGKPNQSPLYTTAAHLEEPSMPPNSPTIPARELDLLRRWIEGGLAEKSGVQAEMQTEQKKQAIAPEQIELADANASNELVAIHPLYQPAPIAVLVGHPEKAVAAMAGQQQVVLLNSDTGEFVGALDFPEGDVTALQFSRDGKWLIAAGGVAGLSGRVVGFDWEAGKRVFELADETDTILGVDLSPDKRLVAVGGPAKVVRVYRVQDGSVVHTLRKHTDWVLTVRFSPDGLLLASGDRFGGLFVWNPASGEEFHVLRGHTGPVNAVSWDGGSETLISGGEDGQLRTWNMHHGELTSAWDAGVGAILGLDVESGKVVAGGRDQAIAAWQGPELELGRFAADTQVEQVAWIAQRVVAGDAAGELHLLDGSLKATRRIGLPIGQEAAAALLVRLDKAEQEYQSQLLARQAAAVAAAVNSSTATKGSASGTEKMTMSTQDKVNHFEVVDGLSTLDSLETQLAFLKASQKRLEELEKATTASLEAAVAALANLHNLQQVLREQQQLNAQLLKELDK